MNPEPRINTLKDLKDFLSEFSDEDLDNIDSNDIVWSGLISNATTELKRKYIKELIGKLK